MATGGLLNGNSENLSTSFNAVLSPPADSLPSDELLSHHQHETTETKDESITMAETNGKTNGTATVDVDMEEKQRPTNGTTTDKPKEDKLVTVKSTKSTTAVKTFKVEIPRISQSKDLRPQKPHMQESELEQCGLLCSAGGTRRDLNKSILKIRSVELEENVKRAKKYAMEQSVRFALVKQTQQAQKQQLELIKKQQALLLMCRIYVGSIFYEVREESVKSAFGAFGPIRSITMSWDAASGKHKGFAFIEFETPEAAALAYEQMNGALMGGRNIKVGRPSNMPQAQPIIEQLTEDSKSYSRIYVASIHPELNESDVQSVFEAFGTIRACSLVRDVQTAKHKGYGFIEYETMQATHDAINAMNMFDLGGQLLRVGRAVTPPESSPDKINQSLLLNHLQQSGGTVAMTASAVAISSAAQAQASAAAAASVGAAISEITASKNSTTSTSNSTSSLSISKQPSSNSLSTITNNTHPTTPTKQGASESQLTVTTIQAAKSAVAQSAVSPLTNSTQQAPSNDSAAAGGVELTENQKKLLGMTSVDDPSASLEQQVELTVKGKEQRMMLMQKLMRRRPESRVVVLRNMVGAEDVDDELENEITDECGKFGEVEKVLIYQEQQGEEEDAEIIVKIFVEFAGNRGVEQAIAALNGRYFAGRVVKAEVYEQELYDARDYSA